MTPILVSLFVIVDNYREPMLHISFKIIQKYAIYVFSVAICPFVIIVKYRKMK